MNRITIHPTFPTIWLAALAMVGSSASATNGSELYVPAQYPTLQSAIHAALAGDTVLVAAGIYTGAGNRDLDLQGKDLVLRSISGPAATIIDCQGTPQDPHRAFLFQSGESRATVLDGFTITGGATLPGAVADEFNGGAVLMVNSSPTLSNCIFRENQAGCWGGAVYSGSSGSPLITGCMFIDNFVGDDGGGFFTWGGASPIIESSVFVGNVAVANGGAIAAFWGGSLTIRQTTIVGNSAPGGSGIVSLAQGGSITNSIIWGNTGAADQTWILSGSQMPVAFSNVQGGYPGIGNLSLNPRFEPDGYHLSQQSPCIDAGHTGVIQLLSTADIDGGNRVSGRCVDIGADEFVSPRRVSKSNLR